MRSVFRKASPLLLAFSLARMSASAASAPAATAATASATSAAASAVAGPMPSLFLAHGGGPCFFLKGGMFEEMDRDSVHADFYRKLNSKLPYKPTAIIVISGHWEEAPGVKVQTGAKPPMLFDYYGFPPEAYEVKFPAPGAPDLAKRVKARLEAAGIPCGEDAKRGFDHGVFVPLKLAYPDADVPVFQLSMHASMDPAIHLRMGAALAPLREEGVLIFGSGATTHNLGAIRSAVPYGKPNGHAVAFVDWLTETLTAVSPRERVNRLLELKKAPYFREMHPREEHLIPLLVAVGAGTPGLVADHKTGKLLLDDVSDVAPAAVTGAADAAAAPAASTSDAVVAADGSVVAGAGTAAAPAPAAGVATLSGKGSLMHKGYVMSVFSMHGYRFD